LALAILLEYAERAGVSAVSRGTQAASRRDGFAWRRYFVPMRILQGRGGPRILVPPRREADLRRRRLRWSARLVATLLLACAIAITARGVAKLTTADQPPLEILFAWHWDYLLVPVMLLGFLLTFRRERLGGLVLMASTLGWLFLARGGSLPDTLLLPLAVGVVVAGACFIWLGGGPR
jgi:hypothetical protein